MHLVTNPALIETSRLLQMIDVNQTKDCVKAYRMAFLVSGEDISGNSVGYYGRGRSSKNQNVIDTMFLGKGRH